MYWHVLCNGGGGRREGCTNKKDTKFLYFDTSVIFTSVGSFQFVSPYIFSHFRVDNGWSTYRRAKSGCHCLRWKFRWKNDRIVTVGAVFTSWTGHKHSYAPRSNIFATSGLWFCGISQWRRCRLRNKDHEYDKDVWKADKSKQSIFGWWGCCSEKSGRRSQFVCG